MERVIFGVYISSFLFYLLSHFFIQKGYAFPYLLRKGIKPKVFAKLAVYTLSLGLLGNLSLISRHFLRTHRLPLTNTPETLLSIISIIVFIYLAIDFKRCELKAIGLLISLISIVALSASFWIFKRPTMPLLPALQSRLLVFHVSSCIIAYCFFTITFVAALAHLFKKELGFNILAIMHRSICLGFFFLTLGIILGSIWGRSAWGHWWNWDPKETWALITWLIYAFYFYGRLFGNWPERKLFWLAVLGFLACLFTYLGVNYLLKGLHSYG